MGLWPPKVPAANPSRKNFCAKWMKLTAADTACKTCKRSASNWNGSSISSNGGATRNGASSATRLRAASNKKAARGRLPFFSGAGALLVDEHAQSTQQTQAQKRDQEIKTS